ncbi:hypothetical protein C8R47DRAFT_1207237 [Mycena vitilis]|nr:hypothetical protein C8R47DRAFT_1207237 [Mycena vitilis]
MTFHLLRRIAMDANSSYNNYLVNALYGRDFLPTRDGSIDGGSIWTFKNCDDEQEATTTKRGVNRPYVAQVFGVVDHVALNDDVLVVRLRCPGNASCFTQKLFDAQVANALSIIAEDARGVDGKVVSSWKATLWNSVSLPFVAGTFYAMLIIDVPTTIRPAFTFPGPGVAIKATVSLKRVETRGMDDGEPRLVRHLVRLLSTD